MKKIEQYNSLDLMKFISAILIIILHTNPFSSYSKIVSFGFRNIVTIIAVPFFFCTSGFLFFKKISLLTTKEKVTYFKKYLKRLFIIYFLWSIVYLPFVIYKWSENRSLYIQLLEYIKNFIFEGSYSTIWFLPALIVAISLCFYLHKIFNFKKILIIAFLIYSIACMMTNYYGLVEKIPIFSNFMENYYRLFSSVKNGVFFGFIFVALGGYISELKIKKSILINGILCIIFGLLLMIESIIPILFKFKQFGCDIKLFLVPFTFYLMLILLQVHLKDRRMYTNMRKISLLLFLSQRIFLSLAQIFLINTIFVKNSMIYFIMILGTTLIFSILFIKISEKKVFLKYFY